MSSEIEKAFKGKGTGPYPDPIKATIVAVGQEYGYTGRNGSSMRAKAGVISDGKTLAKLLCYDDEKFKYLKLNQTVVLRNTVKRVEDGVKVIVLTSASKCYITPVMEVPQQHFHEGIMILNPPAPEVVSVITALSSPPRKRNSVKGKMVQEDQLRHVEVRGQSVQIKDLTLQDETGQVKITMWRDCANLEDIHPGDYIEVTDVVINTYNNVTTLSTTARTKVKKCEAPKVTKLITIEGVSVSGTMAELLLEDGTFLTVESDLIKEAVDINEDFDLERITQDGPLSFKVTFTGMTITDIQKE